jgi:hypothetical protein
MHGARGGAPEGKRNGNYRHGARTQGDYRALALHRVAALTRLIDTAVRPSCGAAT